MIRSDRVLAQVAAGMQDSDAVLEAIKSDRENVLQFVATAISSANAEGVTPARWETIGTRLMHHLERYARAALTEAAEIDIPLDDEEDAE